MLNLKVKDIHNKSHLLLKENLSKVRFLSLLMAVFFLPIHINLNNIFLLIFIITSVFIASLTPKMALENITKNKTLLFVISIPFTLNFTGLLYTDELSRGIDYTVRALPFFLIPLIAILSPQVFVTNYKKMGYALILGCLIVALWSWFFSVQSLLEEGRPFKELFGPLYSNHNLLRNLDMHPTYLSIFIYSAIGFIVLEFEHFKKFKKIFYSIIIFVLLAFMIHLISRFAIFYFIFSSLVYFIYKKYWVLLTGFAIIFILVFAYAYSTPQNYLRDRLIYNLNLFEKKTQFSKKDDRFDRLSASYEIFKERPIIGYGTAAESKYRRAIFKRNKDTVAYNENYNAHNQFMEYLSTFGIIGALAYLLFFGRLFYLVYTNKQVFLGFLLTGVFLACVTESVFERSWGVIYTSFVIAFIVSFILHNNSLKQNQVA